MKLVRGGALTALAIIIVGCGVFGSSDDPSPAGDESLPPAPPPPPVAGKPIEGIFVSSSKGFEDGDGARSRPVRTLGAAIALAKQKNLPVIACAEPYAEAVTLIDGVTMYGYFDCSGAEWLRVTGHASIVSPTSPAVLAEALNLPARFEGFDVTAPDLTGTAPTAATSYGMQIRGSKNLSLAEVVIRAGKGQDGADGAEPAQGNAELSNVAKGSSAQMQGPCTPGPIVVCEATFVEGSPGGTSQCKVGANGSPGGSGGNGPVSASSSYRKTMTAADATGRPLAATTATANGGAPNLVGANVGANGSVGGAGPNGGHGASSFIEDGFVPGDGTPGAIGLPGQGGGGGAGTTVLWVNENTAYSQPPFSPIYYGASGAGGGAGGCGGIPGAPGKGAGASIGLFVIASDKIAIVNGRIEGKRGGRAGKGALGTLGTGGGSGGFGRHGGIGIDMRPSGLYGASGGNGGDGGPAGLGGHGSPGPSIALVFKGARPELTNVELVPGTPGEGVSTSRGSQSLAVGAGAAEREHSF